MNVTIPMSLWNKIRSLIADVEDCVPAKEMTASELHMQLRHLATDAFNLRVAIDEANK